MCDPVLMGDFLKYLLRLTSTNPLSALTGDVYIGMFTAMPTVSASGFSGGTEVSGANYCRQKLNTTGVEGYQKLIDAGKITQSVAFDGGTAETRYVEKIWNQREDIHFPYTGETGNGYGTVVGYGVWIGGTQSGGGKLLFAEALATAKTIGADTMPAIPKEELMFTM